jgi:tetratricopeptide (TPR) repeat protein
MPNNTYLVSRQYSGVMVSSTFTDLKQHREALMNALRREELFAIAMEDYVPIPEDDIISSSLNMVRKGRAYICLISHRYGDIPECSTRNPFGYSATQLEFEEAQRLGLPTLVFVMGDHHPITKNDVETDPEKLNKLEAFKERAKAGRIYSTFENLDAFTSKAIHSVASLKHAINEADTATQAQTTCPTSVPGETKFDPIPTPPAFYAEPAYIGSHKFVGRQSQLDTLSDWADPADSHPVLLFEAIGGTGKSILTWEWTTKYSSNVQVDWAGRFWYSFYEKGATMVDFCRRALAYMTQQPRANFREKNTAELTEPLLHQLQARPWLLVLDGIERILVSYHRFDAAQVLDEEAGSADKIAHRDPCAAINPEDDDLLRALAGAKPSKLLLTTRLIPRVLLNKSNQPIPGVLREHLPGLRTTDAESLIRACGITGTGQDIQNYLKSNCDCHPLVIGVLAGIINDYLPDRGNFDAWVGDPAGGGQLNFATLDLVQKRNHILNVAFAALSEDSRQLLSTLALLSEAVDYPTLCAINPLLPPIPEVVPLPKKPEFSAKWEKLSAAEKVTANTDYAEAVKRHGEYLRALARREDAAEKATSALTKTVKDLESRGLLQYDALTKRHDLHPVVRGISAGGLKHEEKNRYGQRVVDHFSLKAQDPYSQAESVEEFENARHIVKVLFHMGKLEEAHRFILTSTFMQELNFRFEAHNEILTIIRPFFPTGWNEMSDGFKLRGGVQLAKKASIALRRIGALQDAFNVAESVFRDILKKGNEAALCSHLVNMASTIGEQNHLAQENRLLSLASKLALARNQVPDLMAVKLAQFRNFSMLGNWSDAMAVWSQLQEERNRQITFDAIAAHHYALYLFLRGQLTEEELAKAEDVNRSAKSALGNRNLCALRGIWRLEQKDYESAKKSLTNAVALAHKAGKVDKRSEIRLAIAKHHLGELHNPSQVAEDFTYGLKEPCHHPLAELCLLIGDYEQARKHASAAYTWAAADGEPYVRRDELNKAKALLGQMVTEIPKLPCYDQSSDKRLSWGNDVAAAIERIIVQEENKKKTQHARTI